MKQCILWALIAGLSPPAATLAQAAGPAPAWLHFVPGAFPADREPDGNSIVLEDRAGLVVFDTGRHPDHHDALLAIARRTGKPVTAIVNSHWHLDHSGGNRVLRRSWPRAKLYTSGAVRDALDGFMARSLAQAHAALADTATPPARRADLQLDADAISDRASLVPDHEVRGDERIRFRGGELQLHLARNAATAGDTWLYEPRSHTLLAGDLVVLPVPFFDTACASGWRAALDRLQAVPFGTLYPGHGAPMDHAAFDTWRAAFDHLVDCAAGDAPAAQCVAGWLADTGTLIPDAGEQRQARAYLAYYLDEVLRRPAAQQAACAAR